MSIFGSRGHDLNDDAPKELYLRTYNPDAPIFTGENRGDFGSASFAILAARPAG